MTPRAIVALTGAAAVAGVGVEAKVTSGTTGSLTVSITNPAQPATP